MSGSQAIRPLTLGLLQHRCLADPAQNVARVSGLIRQAAAAGAQVICTQELFTSLYFCQTHDHLLFNLAEPVPGPTTRAMQDLAAELGVVIVASLFEKRTEGIYHNTAVVIDADGALLGIYRKHHIPDDPFYHEKFYFTPGDTGFKAFKTKFCTLGVVICWDQWFPEAARLTALKGAEVIFAPTAIGWLAEERETLGDAQAAMWRAVQVGHAVANGVFWAAPNRVGTEANLNFWGGSFLVSPYGQLLAEAGRERDEVLVVDVDLEQVGETRREWPFLRDRRIDAYEGLTKRFLDGSEA